VLAQFLSSMLVELGLGKSRDMGYDNHHPLPFRLVISSPCFTHSSRFAANMHKLPPLFCTLSVMRPVIRGKCLSLPSSKLFDQGLEPPHFPQSRI
jgi:hypothetical protein